MQKKDHNKYPLIREEEDKKIILPGYPTYPESEDIYVQGKEEEEIDPEKITLKKENNENFDTVNIGDDLDIPGSELDDDQEEIGNEDEENNYYSLGGEDHENLEEDIQ